MQLSGALLDRAGELIRMGLKPTEIIDGYELALEKITTQYLSQLIAYEIKDIRNLDEVLPALKTAIMSKQYGNEEFLARLVAEACISVLPASQTSGDLPDQQVSFNVDNIRVCKILGGGINLSHVVHGMVFKKHVEGNFSSASNAKIAVYTCAVDTAAPETKGTVLIKSADELVNFSRGEEELLESQIKAIADSGVKVIVSGAKFGELGLHYCDKYKLTALRLSSKFDVKRLCRSIGAAALLKLRPPTPDEAGFCDEITVDEVGDTPVVIFKLNGEKSKIATIVLRGSTDNIMDDVERALDDGINVFKMITRDGKLLAGAGATEVELARFLAEFSRTLTGLEQYAVAKFGEALLSLVGAIAENSGIKSSEALTILLASHQTQKYAGLDIDKDTPSTIDSTQAKLYDLYLAKYWGMKFAVSASCTILQVDQIICAKPAQGPKPPPSKGAAWDNED